jgi:putative hemolysin
VAGLLLWLGAGAWADRLALGGVVALVSTISIVLGELVPKSLALRSSERFALLAAPALLLLSRVARPAVWVLTAASNLLLRPFHDRTSFSESRLSAEELRQIVEEAAHGGSVDARAGEIAARALDLVSLHVGAVMVPRGAVATLPVTASPREVRRTLATHPHARLPVTGTSPDDVLGYVLAREIYAQLLDGRLDLRAALHPIPRFDEGTRAVDVLKALQGSRAHVGLVVDGNGAPAGLVSVGDLVEEVLGEMAGEREVPEALVQREAGGSVLVPGRAPVHALNRELGIDLPVEPGWSTLAGLVLHLAGTIPQAGARLVLPGGIEAEVVEATARCIGRLRLRLPAAGPDGPGEPAAPAVRSGP